MITLNKQVVEFITFPNNEHRLDLDESLLNDNNKVLWKYENDSSIFELLLFNSSMRQLGATYELVIAYMPYSRMDRVEKQSTAFSLKALTELLLLQLTNVMSIKVFDPHSKVTLELLGKSTIEVSELEYSLADDVLANVDLEKSWVVFPDKGAAARYNYEKYPNVIICDKTRDFATGRIIDLVAHVHKHNSLLENQVEGQFNVYIIDDLCSFGGTFVRAIDASLKAINSLPNETHLIVSHSEDSIYNGQVFEVFDKVTTTDSLLTNFANEQLTVRHLVDVI